MASKPHFPTEIISTSSPRQLQVSGKEHLPVSGGKALPDRLIAQRPRIYCHSPPNPRGGQGRYDRPPPIDAGHNEARAPALLAGSPREQAPGSLCLRAPSSPRGTVRSPE